MQETIFKNLSNLFVILNSNLTSSEPTIIETPAHTMIVERKPSDMFMVTHWLTTEVSVDNRFISSPVLFWSKNATSCFITEPNTLSLNALVILCPEIWYIQNN